MTAVPSEATTADSTTTEFDVVVVGAGFGGIYALAPLRELGFSVRVLRDGRRRRRHLVLEPLPRLSRCDVPSLEYSYGFSKELQQEWEWTEIMPAQDEIEEYLNHVVDRFDLRRDIQLGTTVTAATFDEDAVAVAGRDRHRRAVLRPVLRDGDRLPVGPDRRPTSPGRDSFAGRILQTSLWPREGVDLTGLRVGLIGTGSSGVQSTPEIAARGRAPLRVPAHGHLLLSGRSAA